VGVQVLAPGRRLPRTGEQWHVNFSRVEWLLDARDGQYVKRTDPARGKPVPADNWVWSPQGVVDVHIPERWGYVQFSTTQPGGGELFVLEPNGGVGYPQRLSLGCILIGSPNFAAGR